MPQLSLTKATLAIALLILLQSFTPTTVRAATPRLEWTSQLGTFYDDWSFGVSADGSGNVYISGITGGNLGGPVNGSSDAFLSKHAADGTLLWTRQQGSSGRDSARSISTDGLGNVYIAGTFGTALSGGSGRSAFVSKYDANGMLLWTEEQLGVWSGDGGWGVSADRLGNVYISGTASGNLGGTNAGSFDAFVSKYDTEGTLLWSQQLGTTEADWGYDVSADGLGNVYIAGRTFGDLGGTSFGSNDAFVSKYDVDGTLLWTEQLGTSSGDESLGVSADAFGNVYITGGTGGDLGGTNAGNGDAFVSKYGADGALHWTKQLGTTDGERSLDVFADGLGGIYITGHTYGSLEGANAGNGDAFVSKYDVDGALLWTKQLGTPYFDSGYGVAADGLGSVYISGITRGSLVGTGFGNNDAFVAKYSEVPEPSTLLLGAMASLGLLRWKPR